MSFIAGYLLGLGEGGGANIQSLSVTENKEYNAADYGCDGFNPVDVNVPDRYDEGYQDGYDEGYADGEAAVKAKIQSKTITANGTYTAAADGLDGFDPVIVNVADRYDEGYQDGVQHGEYIFPDDTSFDDIFAITDGTSNIIDKTRGQYLGIRRYTRQSSETRYVTEVGIFDSSTGELADGGYFWAWDGYGFEDVKIVSVNTATGEWKIVKKDYYGEYTIFYTGTSKALIGFGAAGNQIGVQNQK